MKKDSIVAFQLTTKIQYSHGVIGVNEFLDRIDTLREIMNDNDNFPNVHEFSDEEDNEIEFNDEFITSSNEEGEIIHLVPLGLKEKWVFTLGDKDSFPSVPHGHKNDKNNKWPKLNPYTGYIYRSKIQIIKRLTKLEMKNLWNNQDFRNFCYKHVDWYCDSFPCHRFSVDYKKRFRFPKW